METQTSVAAFSGLYSNADFIHKFHGRYTGLWEPAEELEGNYAYVGFLSSTVFRKGHLASRFGKQSVVASATDVFTWMEFSASLSDENVSSGHDFTTVFLDSQPFGLGIAAVSGLTTRFFMCHR